MSFAGALFGGQNKTLDSDIHQMGNLASFLNNTGTADTATASNFDRTLLSGDSTAIAKLLAPHIAGIQQRQMQQRLQLANFGNRSGGTTAASIKAGDDTTGSINDLIAKLTGGAASEIGELGTKLLSQGQSAVTEQAKLSQQQMENWRNSILGKSIGTAVGAAETFGLGGAAGVAAGGSFMKGGASALDKFLMS